MLLGNGDGTFQTQPAATTAAPNLIPYGVTWRTSPAMAGPTSSPPNVNDDSVSVLLQNSDGTFQTRQTFPTGAGTGPGAVAVADLTGDGIPDIITADYKSNSVSVLLGNGDGTFQAPRILPVGDAPNDVIVADLRGDGKEDIVTANEADNTVSVLLGNGDGTFQPQQSYPVGDRPVSVAVADLTGNGILDIVAANHHDGTVSVLMGTGNGTFKPEMEYAAGGS